MGVTQDVVAFDVYNHCWRSLTRLPAQRWAQRVCRGQLPCLPWAGRARRAAPAAPSARPAGCHGSSAPLRPASRDDGAPYAGSTGPISGAAPWARGLGRRGLMGGQAAGFGGKCMTCAADR